jgi:hypothetical protein
MNLNSGDKTVAMMFINVGISKSICVLRVLMLKIAMIAIGIIGVSAKPRMLLRIFMLRRLILPLLANIVPASDKIIITVRIIPMANGFLRYMFKVVLVFNKPSKRKSAAMSRV